MHYLIQENLFSERNYYTILQQLEKMGATFDVVSIHLSKEVAERNL